MNETRFESELRLKTGLDWVRVYRTTRDANRVREIFELTHLPPSNIRSIEEHLFYARGYFAEHIKSGEPSETAQFLWGKMASTEDDERMLQNVKNAIASLARKDATV